MNCEVKVANVRGRYTRGEGGPSRRTWGWRTPWSVHMTKTVGGLGWVKRPKGEGSQIFIGEPKGSQNDIGAFGCRAVSAEKRINTQRKVTGKILKEKREVGNYLSARE